MGLDIRVERLLERLGVDRESDALSSCLSSESLEIRGIPGYGDAPLLLVPIRGANHVQEELRLALTRLQGLRSRHL